MKKLSLKRETLVELSADDLVSVAAAAGGAEDVSAGITYTCPTYTCVFPTANCPIVISRRNCFNISNGCTGC